MLTIIVNHLISKIYTFFVSLKRGVSLDLSSKVYYKSKIHSSSSYNNLRGKIIIGSKCKIGTSHRNYHCGIPFPTTLLCEGSGSEIIIGDNCRLNGVYVHAKKKVYIGNNCVMASGINIIDSNGHVTKSLDRTKGGDSPMDIVIGNNVWIGMNAIILKGSVIEDNSIISAGSVVRGHVPANTIYSTHDTISTRTIEF